MAEPVRIAHNAIVAKLIDAPKTAQDAVSELLSYDVQGHEFVISFQSGSWSGRSSFFSHASNSFPAGFVEMAEERLKQLGFTTQRIAHPLPKALGPENPIVDEFGNDDPRYNFQMHAVRQVERHGRGILQVATGGGKSKIAKLLIARFRRPALFLTTRGILMYQMKTDIEVGRMRAGVIGDGEWSPHPKGINVGMVQTMVARLQMPDHSEEARAIVGANINAGVKMTPEKIKKLAAAKVKIKLAIRAETIAFLESIEVIIGEEAHEAGGNSYFAILKHCKNAQIRVALTATPFMKDDIESNMRLMAAFGPILIKVSEELLIKRGILAKPYFKFKLSEPHAKLRKTSPWQRAYTLGYVENTFMHADIVRDALLARKYGLPVICLIQRKNHGGELIAALRKAGLQVLFIQGENNQDERKMALTKLKNGDIDALIGTTILDVGVDVPAAGLIQLAGGGKAEVALRQRIGRGLRAKKNMPNFCFVIDYSTSNNSTLRDHARQRRGIIESTPGFVEGIVADQADLPWHLFNVNLKTKPALIPL